MPSIDIDELPDELKTAIGKHLEEKEAAKRGGGRSENIDVYIDLSDEAAVQRGLDLGFLKASDLEDGGGEGGGDGGGEGGGEGEGAGKGGKGGKETAPRRRGYFKEGAE